MQPVVSVTNLRKTFNAVTAVDGISFTINPGEIYGLLGVNGAGKTTVTQLLLGIITPDEGEIRIFGQRLQEHREEILRRVNFSSSYVSLPWNLTVEENLKFFAKLYGVQDAPARIRELLDAFDLAKLRQSATGKLSSGQLTRLFLAKALVNRPKLLLLDEPTASLDPDIADRTRQTLKSLAARDQVTMLFTSHNMSEVEFMCQRVAFLHHGKFIMEGSPTELIVRYSKRNLEDVFLHLARAPQEAGA